MAETHVPNEAGHQDPLIPRDPSGEQNTHGHLVVPIDVEIGNTGPRTHVRIAGRKPVVRKLTVEVEANRFTILTLEIIRTRVDQPITIHGRMIIEDPEEAAELAALLQRLTTESHTATYTDPAFDPETPIEEQLAEVTAAEQGS